MQRKPGWFGGGRLVEILYLVVTLWLGLWNVGCVGVTASNPGSANPPAAAAPVISGLGTSSISANSATITWTTSAPATSQVEYGATSNYGSSTPLNSTLATSHVQALNNLTPGAQYHYRVRSRDANNRESVSGDSTFSTTTGPDTTPPVISGVSASNLSANSALINWTTNKAADSQVGYGTTVSYGKSSAPDASLVLSHAISLAGLTPSTLYHYRVKSKDAAGNPATSGDFIFTTTATPDTTPPTVAITSPSSGATVSGMITITATASDDVGVVGVQFKVDGTNTGAELTAAPYSYSLDTRTLSNGNHALTAVARDAAGNTATSAAVSITVNNAGSTPPTVSLTSPAPGATLSGTATISASASDSLGVAGVQFLLNGANLGAEVRSAPYNFSWNTTAVADGSHTLSARARNSAGQTATAAGVQVTVRNATGPVVRVGPADAWCDAINQATPGTQVILAAGTYADPCVISASGTSAAPITVRSESPDPSNRAVLAYAGTSSNVIDTTGSFLILRWLSFGPSQDGVDAVRIRGGHDLLVDQNFFQGVGGVSVVSNDVDVQRVTVRDNVFQNLKSTAMYFGCHDGGPCHLTELLIEGNLIDGVAPPDASIGYGLEIKLNSWGIVRDNTVYRTKGPGLMVYGSNRNDPPSIVEGNYVEGSRTDAGINVGGGPAIVRNNVVVGNAAGGVWAQNYGGRGLQKNVWIVHNTALNNSDTGINVESWSSGNGNVLAFNAVAPLAGTLPFRPSAPASTLVGNVSCDPATSCFDQPTTAPYDLWPLVGGPLIGAAGSGPEPWRPTDDFMGVSRGSAADVGAFQRTSSGSGPGVGGGAPRPKRGTSGPPDTTPPNVSITAPASGATVAGAVTVTASASDNVGVVGVQFKVDGANTGPEITTPPYSYSLDTRTFSDGSHSLTAVARDAAGNTATSTAVSITVSNGSGINPPPVISAVTATNVTAFSAMVSWTTNKAADSQVDYGTTSGYGQSTSLDPTLVSTHAVNLSGLNPTTLYHYRVRSKDAAGNQGISGDFTFTTAIAPPPPPPAADNTITINEKSGRVQSSRPVSVARAFRQGDIQTFVQASVGGTALLTQTDVKNRWPDGSVKYAIVSFVIPSLPANGSVVVSFSNQSTGNNSGHLTQADMLDPAYDFDAAIQMAGGSTQTVSARAMLANGNFRYWLQGPVVTAVILEDRTPTRSYDKDFGDGSKALHPIFEAWFYPQNHKVDVGYTVENAWVSSDATKAMRDLTYSVTLTAGSASPVTRFTNPTFTHIGRSRWHKRFWIGADPPAVRIDHNMRYWVSTKAIPNWDTTIKVADSLVASKYGAWTGADQTLGGNSVGIGNYNKALDAAGAADWIGLASLWDILYLYTMDDRMLQVSLGNADLAGRIPWHLREADQNAGTGRFFDRAGTVSTFGRLPSINARKQATFSDFTDNCSGTIGNDKINTGPINQDAWATTRDHMPDVAYIPYLFSGRYYYLEEAQMQAAWIAGWKQGCVDTTAPWDRQGDAGYLHDSEVRGDGWGFRTLTYASFISPDGSPEKAYFEDKVLNNITEWQGVQDLPLTDSTRQVHWDFGHTYRRFGTGPSPLGRWAGGEPGLISWPVIQDGSVEASETPFEENFLLAAFGVARDFGYPTDALLKFMARDRFNQVLNPVTSPYLSEVYQKATIIKATHDWIRSWADVNKYHVVPTGWKSASEDTADHSYGFINMAAISFLLPYTVDGYTGQQAWNWIKANKPNQETFATDSPKWAIVPRVGAAPPDTTPPTVTITSPTSGQTVSGTIVVSATASDNVGVVGVQLRVDGTNTGAEIPTAPYTYSLNTTSFTNGTHVLTAVARDAAGNSATSAPVTILVNNAVGTPPVLSAVTARGVTSTAATITWTTNVPATSQVEYGASSAYGSSTAVDSNLVISHSQALSGLSPNTLYHYRVRSRSAAGAEGASGDFTFTTLADTSPPVISGVSVSPNMTSAFISWTTNKPSDTQAEYGTSAAYGQSTPLDTTQVTGHSVMLSGLNPSTLYHFRVRSRDAAGNLAVSGDATFTTLSQPSGGIPPNLGWFEVPNTKLSTPGTCPPNPSPNYPNEGCSGVISGWSGGIADTLRNRLIVWGGGHTSYYGNEVYTFDLNDLRMKRLNNPSPVNPTPQQCVEALPDGTANSRHTYGGLAYMDSADKMFVFGGVPSCEPGNTTNGAWTLDFGTMKWTRKDPASGGQPMALPGAIASYDPNTNKVYLSDTRQFWSYDLARNAYTLLNADAAIDYRMSSVVDPKRKLFIAVGGGSVPEGGMKVFDISSGSRFAMQNWSNQVSGCGGSTGAGSPGLAYDPVQDRIVIWPNFGNTVYMFNPDTKSCTARTFSGGPPDSSHDMVPSTSRGTFGRFAYFPKSGVFVVVNDWAINAFTLRLTTAQTGGAISSVTLNNLIDTSVTVQWTTNDPTDSQVECGLFSPTGFQTSLDLTPVVNHSQTLNYLTPSTTYVCQVKSRDAQGNLVVSNTFSFTTAAAQGAN